MRKKYLILTILLLVSMFSVFPFLAKAQVQNESLILTLTPSSPRANESVTAVISSNAVDLGTAKISWILNGQTSIEKIGQKSFSFNTGSAGSKTTIEAKIETSDGTLLTKDLTISPTDIDILYEASDTYTPPFYKGLALPSIEGPVKVTAMPNSNSLSGLSYSWSQDGNPMPDSSGFGKSYYAYKNTYLETDNTVSVDISDLSGNVIGSGDVTITPTTPKILFYEKDPIFGTLWENALNDSATIKTNGETLVAEPYFVWPENLNSSSLNFKWSIDDSDTTAPDVINQISIKPEAGQSGQSKISLAIENINSLFLSITKDLNVNF